jgi:hypothetical protein
LKLKQQQARQKKQAKHRRKRKAEAVREQYDPNDVRWTAAHEAGHAVAAIAYGIPLAFVDIRKRRMPGGWVSTGFTRTPPLRAADAVGWGRDEAWPYLIQSMAGPAAEAQADPLYAIKGGADAQDRKDTMLLAAWAVCGVIETPDGDYVPRDAVATREEEIEALCRLAEAGATLFVGEYRAEIEAVAAALIQKTSLTGDEVAAIVEAATTE